MEGATKSFPAFFQANLPGYLISDPTPEDESSGRFVTYKEEGSNVLATLFHLKIGNNAMTLVRPEMFIFIDNDWYPNTMVRSI